MTKSYIKLYGPPVMEGLQALEKIALSITSKDNSLSYYHACLPREAISAWQAPTEDPMMRYDDYMQRYYNMYNEDCVLLYKGLEKEVKNKLISKSGHTLGEYDFYFEWIIEPKDKDLFNLIKIIDTEMKTLNLRYSIVTK